MTKSMKYREFFKIQEHSKNTVHIKIGNQDQIGIHTGLMSQGFKRNHQVKNN